MKKSGAITLVPCGKVDGRQLVGGLEVDVGAPLEQHLDRLGLVLPCGHLPEFKKKQLTGPCNLKHHNASPGLARIA
jgi:hypothetical protein